MAMSEHENITLVDIGERHRRGRQPSLIADLQAALAKAESGEMVGMLILHVNNKGVWQYDRNTFHSDTPTLIGYLQLVAHRLITEYLDSK